MHFRISLKSFNSFAPVTNQLLHVLQKNVCTWIVTHLLMILLIYQLHLSVSMLISAGSVSIQSYFDILCRHYQSPPCTSENVCQMYRLKLKLQMRAHVLNRCDYDSLGLCSLLICNWLLLCSLSLSSSEVLLNTFVIVFRQWKLFWSLETLRRLSILLVSPDRGRYTSWLLIIFKHLTGRKIQKLWKISLPFIPRDEHQNLFLDSMMHVHK